VTRRGTRQVVQHSWGVRGTGGPVGALERLKQAWSSDQFEFVDMHQDSVNGAIDFKRLRAWRSFLRVEKPAIVHVRGLGNEGFHGALAARLAGVPGVLVSVHGTHRDLSGPMTPKRWLMTRVLEPVTLRMAT
jgi:hypothetical protein